MASLKDKARRAVTAMMVATMATAVFTGCTPSRPDGDSSGPDLNFGDNSNNSSITDTDDTYGIKYKYWYDNLEDNGDQLTGLTATGDYFMGFTDLPIYEKGGKYYIQSGKSQIEIVDGKISDDDIDLLRTEHGDKIYFLLEDVDVKGRVEYFENWKRENGYEVDATLEERMAADAANGQAEKDLMTTADLYVNSMTTNTKIESNKIYVDTIFNSAMSLGYVKHLNDSEPFRIGLLTAAGEIIVTITVDGSDCKISYSTNDDAFVLTNNVDMGIDGNRIWMTPSAIESVLGYDVEICEGTDADDVRVNIVTDTHDKFVKENTSAAASDRYDYIYEPKDTNSGGSEDNSSSSTTNPDEESSSTPSSSSGSDNSSAPSGGTGSGNSSTTPPSSSTTPPSSSTTPPSSSTTPSGGSGNSGALVNERYEPTDTAGIIMGSDGFPEMGVGGNYRGRTFVDADGVMWFFQNGKWHQSGTGGQGGDIQADPGHGGQNPNATM